MNKLELIKEAVEDYLGHEMNNNSKTTEDVICRVLFVRCSLELTNYSSIPISKIIERNRSIISKYRHDPPKYNTIELRKDMDAVIGYLKNTYPNDFGEVETRTTKDLIKEKSMKMPFGHGTVEVVLLSEVMKLI